MGGGAAVGWAGAQPAPKGQCVHVLPSSGKRCCAEQSRSVCCSYVRPEFVEEEQPPQLHIEAVRAWGGLLGKWVGWVPLEWCDVPELVGGIFSLDAQHLGA